MSTDGFSLEEGREYEEGPASEPIEIPEETPPLPDSEPAFDWTILQRIAGITLTLLLLAAAVMAVRGFWPGRRRRGVEDFFPGEDPFLAPTLWMASQVSRDFDLSDPRERVLHAYHQLLFALGRVGSPRYLHEGPMEHLSRAEARFPLPRGPLRGLGRLYVRAEYDRRPMEWEAGSQADEMLDQSLTALWDARPDLRPTAGGQ